MEGVQVQWDFYIYLIETLVVEGRWERIGEAFPRCSYLHKRRDDPGLRGPPGHEGRAA